jgi:hypothetical protein
LSARPAPRVGAGPHTFRSARFCTSRAAGSDNLPPSLLEVALLQVKEPLARFSERLDPLLQRRAVAALLLLVAAALGVASALAVRAGIEPGIRGAEALEQVVMARRLAQGEGFTTSVIYPAELSLGAGADHPAVRQPPLWPLVLALPFALFGADAGTADGASVALFGLLVAAAAGLAAARGGLLAGAVTALAVAFTSANRLLALEPVSATLFGVMIALVLWLCAAGAPAFAIGLACGLAYLTRYSGILLLPAALALLFAGRRDRRALLLCCAGFLVAALPWWIRNAALTGHPFYTLQALAAWIAPGPLVPGIGPLFELEPGAHADPLVKLTTQLPLLLASLPFANANLAALAGIVLGIVRRDTYCAVLAGLAAIALLLAAVTLPHGAEAAPLFPSMIALGAAAWMRHGGWLRGPALALVAAAAWLPGYPEEPRDLRQLRNTREYLQDPSTRESMEARDKLRRCLDGATVLAHGAPRVAWQTDAIALYAPVSDALFYEIADAHAVAFVQGSRPGGSDAARFAAEFSPRPDCAPDLFERKRAD